jgi:hypothetical protein
MQAAEPEQLFDATGKIRARPREDRSVAEVLDPEPAGLRGVPAVQLGLVKVAPADL